jgi:parallel beta-helix repeat protein
VIVGNTVRNCKNAGISLFFTSRRITINGNTVINDYPFAEPPDGFWVRAGIWLTYTNREQFPNDSGHRDVTIVGNTIHCVDEWRRPIWIGKETGNLTVAWNTLTGGNPERFEAKLVQPLMSVNIDENTVIYGGP